MVYNNALPYPLMKEKPLLLGKGYSTKHHPKMNVKGSGKKQKRLRGGFSLPAIPLLISLLTGSY